MGKRVEQTFLQRRSTVANKPMRRYSTPLIIKEMQVRAGGHHLTPTRTAGCSQNNSKNVATRMWRNCCPSALWGECGMVQPLWEIVGSFSTKLQIKLPCDPAILLWVYTCQSPRAAVTKCHRLKNDLNDRNLFSHSWEARSPRSRGYQGWFLVRPFFLACGWLTSCCVPPFQGAEASGVSASSQGIRAPPL